MNRIRLENILASLQCLWGNSGGHVPANFEQSITFLEVGFAEDW